MVNRRDLLRLGGLAALGATAAPLLSACQGGSGGGSGGGGAQLQFMYWGSTFEQKAINAMLDKFEKDHEGSTVRPIYTPEEYDTKMNTLVASKRPPDVAYMGSAIGYRLADQGKLVNLFDHFDKYPGLAERLPGTYFWYGKDKTFGTQTANEVMLLWYNKKSLDDAGVEHPPASADKAWTWDQLVENAHKLTVDREGKHPDESGFDPKQIKQFGVSVNIEFPGMWYGLLRSNGVDVVDESGKKCLLDTPEAIEVFQNLQDLIYKYHVAPTPAQTGGDSAPPSNVQLQTRRIAMVFDGQWILLDMSQSDLDYGIGVLPTYQEPMTASMGGASVIFSESKYPEEAVELFMYHNDPAHVDLYSNGLWMPLERKYYTEPEFIAKWAENDVHPPEFKTAVIDYTVNNSAAVFGQRLKNMDKIDTILTPALQQIQTGKRPAADVLKELTPKIDKLLLGWNPTQEL